MKAVPPDRNTPSDAGYVYHASNLERARDIATEGLKTHRPSEFTDQDEWPDGGIEKRVYFTPRASSAWQFAPEEGRPILLRVSASLAKPERGTGDVFSRKPVPAKEIEILTTDGWQPITNWLTAGASERRGVRESNPLADLFVATKLQYPTAGSHVDGLTVRDHVPNLSSIDGYFASSKTLPGVRVVPMSDLGGPHSVFYAADDFARSERLAEAIRTSGEINPLIIGVDEKGAFIIEGAHRFVALYYLKAREFPAVVVVGQD